MFGNIDPFLGYGYSETDFDIRDDENKLPGFVVYNNRNDEADADSRIKIVALGGSTTTPHFPDNWPRQLFDILSTEDTASVVYNGGVSGYTSSQELLKLIRDVLPLRPDLVISYNGINEMDFIHSLPRHPMIHNYLDKTMRYVLNSDVPTKSRKGRITGISYGPQVRFSPAQVWLANVRAMRALCSEFGVEYICFIQPTMGIGNYQLSEKEQSMLKTHDDSLRGRYVKKLKELYSEITTLAYDYQYIQSLVHVFDHVSDVYYDCRHPNATGYQIVAKNIYQYLMKHSALR